MQCKRLPAVAIPQNSPYYTVDWAEASASTTQVFKRTKALQNLEDFPESSPEGPFNTWGYDRGINNKMIHRDDGMWELDVARRLTGLLGRSPHMGRVDHGTAAALRSAKCLRKR